MYNTHPIISHCTCSCCQIFGCQNVNGTNPIHCKKLSQGWSRTSATMTVWFYVCCSLCKQTQAVSIVLVINQLMCSDVQGPHLLHHLTKALPSNPLFQMFIKPQSQSLLCDSCIVSSSIFWFLTVSSFNGLDNGFASLLFFISLVKNWSLVVDKLWVVGCRSSPPLQVFWCVWW